MERDYYGTSFGTRELPIYPNENRRYGQMLVIRYVVIIKILLCFEYPLQNIDAIKTRENQLNDSNLKGLP